MQGHHITHWAAGGETSLENLTQLCWFHHHLIHEGGFGLVKDPETKALVFSRPHGRVIDRVRGRDRAPQTGSSAWKWTSPTRRSAPTGSMWSTTTSRGSSPGTTARCRKLPRASFRS
ncbi:MAG TPA: HNH endonuclease signature motif containing protein [Actinomycetota bacterium]|nr:HNH endonuclease signature motif containing protein [Actinomycetota bacterium]